MEEIDHYLSNPQEDFKTLKGILQSGSINGLYSHTDSSLIFEHLSKKFEKFVRVEVIGETFQKKPINAYLLSSDFGNFEKKSKVLFTGLHHARELLTVQMIVQIFLQSLRSLTQAHQIVDFWSTNDVILVPIINIDSYIFISDSFGTEDFESFKWKRKNMND